MPPYTSGWERRLHYLDFRESRKQFCALYLTLSHTPKSAWNAALAGLQSELLEDRIGNGDRIRHCLGRKTATGQVKLAGGTSLPALGHRSFRRLLSSPDDLESVMQPLSVRLPQPEANL
jgi:hypothetical protein